MGASSAAQKDTEAQPPAQGPLVVPAGDRILLRLPNSLSTKGAKKGDQVELKMAHDLFLGNQMVLPRGLIIRATVTQSHRRRPITALDRPELHLRLNHVVLPDGSRIPFSAKFLRAGRIELKQRATGEVELRGQGAGKWEVASAGGSAAMTGGPIGAAVGAASSLVAQGMMRPRDIDLPPGITFEIELTCDLEIPAETDGLAEWHPSLAARVLIPSSSTHAPGPAPASMPVPGDTRAAAGAASLDRVPEAAAAAVGPAPVPAPPGAFNLKVNVDLVTVEGVVRDSTGRLIDDLKVEDFLVQDDGVAQHITHFSRDQLPLAVALVVDRSGSVARHLEDLHQAALATIGELKPEDLVAVFAFAEGVMRLTDLTADRRAAAEPVSGLEPTGGTNIYDAIFDAAQYLRAAAPDRRRAIILISDNQPTTLGRASESGAIRMALETEAVIYSVKTPGVQQLPKPKNPPPLSAGEALWVGDSDSVPRIAQETGGEVLDVAVLGSLSEALASAISRLKSRYTLAYTPSNHARDGRFHRIEVRLAERFGDPGKSYKVRARRGYYASVLSQSSR
jgi:Ca-activated chloride channel family protein